MCDLDQLIAGLWDEEDFDALPPPPRTSNPGAHFSYQRKLQALAPRYRDIQETQAIFAKALIDAFKLLPPVDDEALFTVPIHQLPEAPPLVEKMLAIFNAHDIVERGLFENLRAILERNALKASGTLGKRRSDVGERIRPTEYKIEGSPREVVDAFLRDTPLRALFDATVPFEIDDARFAHQWTVGRSKSGKTTVLSALINDDLKKVERGEACVVIMDSQNDDLSYHLPRLKIFAPGGALHDKLTYLEPTLAHPLALNIFSFTKTTDIRTIEFMVGFFVGSVVGDVSGLMRTIIKYVLRAIALIPEPTVYDFKNLLEKRGAEKYDLKLLNHDTLDFLTRRMFEGNYVASIGALKTRLDGFTADELFAAMFSQKENRFDLAIEADKPQVIVINTHKGKLYETCGPFGRYFLAQLLHVSRQRQDMNRKLPLYFYCDEAHDYISEEIRTVELIDEVRKQEIALIFASQRAEKITASGVLAALEDTGIQARCQQPFVSLAIEDRPPVQVKVPFVTFKKMTHMSDGQFAGILNEMHQRFSIRPQPSPNPSSASPGPTPESPEPSPGPSSAAREPRTPPSDTPGAW